MQGWDPGADWNPERARPEQLVRYASDLLRVASDIDVIKGRVAATIGGLAWRGVWTGSGASAADALAGDLGWALDLLAEGMATASVEVSRYADELESCTRAARDAARGLTAARSRAAAVAADPPTGPHAAAALAQAGADLVEEQRRVRLVVMEADAAASRCACHLDALLDPYAGGALATVTRVADRLAVVSEGIRAIAGSVPVLGRALAVTSAVAVPVAVLGRAWLAVHHMGRWNEVPLSTAGGALPGLLGRPGLPFLPDLPVPAMVDLVVDSGDRASQTPVRSTVPGSAPRPLVDQAVDARDLPARMGAARSGAASLECAPPTASATAARSGRNRKPRSP